MNSFELVKNKLEGFIKKYYLNELIKGFILFIAIGVLYFLITLMIEYFLWLNSSWRTVLFWLFITVEVGLFIKFILIPIARLFKLTRGIDYEKSSKIIGNHFTDVNDKLLNLLQLSEDKSASSLLLASIEQKSNELNPIPFRTAVDFRKNRKYLKYLIIPVMVFLLVTLFSKSNWFSESYNRVVNYETAYEPPAPFQFIISNKNLNALEKNDFLLNVEAVGDVLPEDVKIVYNDEVYFLKNKGTGEFQYTFVQPKETIDFVITSNEVTSKKYTLSVVPVPSLLDFIMKLDYPSYVKKKNEVLKSSGNATVPEGTKVSWEVMTRNTDKVEIKTKDSIILFDKEKSNFHYTSRLFSDFDYDITTSNTNIKGYDNLSFNINVVKDEYPELNVASEKDSIDNNTMYFYGRMSDDYGLNKLRMVYYNIDDDTSKKLHSIPINSEVFDEFVFEFPGKIKIEDGVNYELYFEVFDNDAIHKYKSTKSQVFNFRKLTLKENEDKRLNEQNKAISGLNKSLKKFEEQQQDLKELSKLQKEKKQLDFNDKKKLEEYLKRQKEQEKMMKSFSNKLKDNLEKTEDKKEEPFKDALKEMMERNEERLKKNEKLLDEIEKLADKINKEELTEKLEELGKENKNLKKNLEQLLELTKRFYVIEKHEKLADKLKELSEDQKQLSEKKEEENTKEKQDELNEKFEKFQKEMEELRKDNEGLKKPMDLDQKKNEEEEIKKEQQEASKKLEKKNKSEAQKNQKSAAQKMKKMQEQMQSKMQSQMGGGGEQQQEDAEMLRQILDNLVDFSIEQEGLMKSFRGTNVDNPSYSGKLRKQSVLRENFIHIDDSLYALALRTPKISDKVTEKLTEIEYNIDKSLERLAENQVVQGTSNQQYTITGSNDLAYFLSKVLDQMQNSMSSSGSGKSGDSKGFQLPDIIKKQEELNEQMKEGTEKGKKDGKEKGDNKGSKSGDKEGSSSEKKDSKNGKGKGSKDGKGKSKGEKEGEEKGKSEMQREDMNGELYEIFKQQQQLRNALEEKIRKQGRGNKSGSDLLRKMEQVERELLEKGFNERTLSKMLDLKHELLKLDDATFEQGEEERRESNTNTQVYEGNQNNQIQKAKQYFNTTEILNRQVLPLRQNYKQRVQEYFKKSND